jgi:peptide/nickel transport system substrate-binding protein
MVRSPLAATVALVACLAVAACGGGSGGGGSGGGDVLRVGQPPFTAIGVPNPFNATSVNQFTFVYPTLVTYDEQGRFVPDFAKSWKASADGRTWTFDTQVGAKWSDGKPLTADDAAWSIDTVVKYRNSSTANLSSYTVSTAASATAPDSHTVVVRFDKPTGTALAQLAAAWILPRHVWEQHATGPGGNGLTTFANTPPFVSGGPFVWTKYKKDVFSYFVRNDNYFGPKSKIKAFGIQAFSDEDAMLSALESGQLDAVDYMSPANLAAVKKAGLAGDSSPATSIDYLQINSNQDPKTKYPELRNVKVREALDLAIDRQQMVELVYGGQATPGRTIVADVVKQWVDPSLQPLPFDIGKANRILDSLGYERGGDGIRVAAGHKMSYKVVFPTYLTGPGDREFQIVRDGWKQIGVEVSKQALDPDAARVVLRAPDNTYLDFAIGMSNELPFPDPSSLLVDLTCGAWGPTGNNTGYCDPSYDRLWAAQSREPDLGKREQILYAMERKVRAAHTLLPLVYPNNTYAYSKRWTGFKPGPGGWFGGPSSLTTIAKTG